MSHSFQRSMFLTRSYYQLKPFIPWRVRRSLRRIHARRVLRNCTDTWPIDKSAGYKPVGWPGWPENKKFALVLTHDVESEVGLERVRRLAEMEMKWDIRSSFNFIPEGPYRVPKDLLRWLVNNGFEVGVHDLHHDGKLYRSGADFIRKSKRINHYLEDWGATGFRSGFMLNQLDWLHGLNIQYDASTFDTDPFEPQPEGRHTIFPFWVPRDATSTWEPSSPNHSLPGYVELPYTLPQDSTLFLLLRKPTIDIWREKLDWIADHGGMALLNAHPDYMSFEAGSRKKREFTVELYREFLSYVHERYGDTFWKPLPREVAAHVIQHKNREHFDLDKRWRLRGKRGAVLLFSHYPADPRPRRAAEALTKEGVTIDLICLRQDGNEPKRETIEGVTILRVPLKRRRSGRLTYIAQYAAFVLVSFACLSFRSLTRRYDFVHVHNMPDVLVFSALVQRLLGAKIILDLHDPMPELMRTIFKLPERGFSIRLLKRLEKWSIAFAHSVLTVNLACKKIYASRSCAAEKIHVVLNSPEDDVFAFQPPTVEASNGEHPARPFVILYHGSLVERNGFDLAIDALAIVRNRIPNARLRVCGAATAFFEKVMSSAERRGLRESVDYAGMRNRKQIVDDIHSCDLGVIPNHRNIFTEINTPTRIFEYLALGKPVIAPRAQGIQDYFGDQDLLFFDLGDATNLAQQIEYAFSHPTNVQEIVKRGQQVYLAHTWTKEKQSLLNHFSELL